MLGFDWMWNSGFTVLHFYLMAPVVARCFSRSDCELLLQLEQINRFFVFFGTDYCANNNGWHIDHRGLLVPVFTIV